MTTAIILNDEKNKEEKDSGKKKNGMKRKMNRKTVGDE